VSRDLVIFGILFLAWIVKTVFEKQQKPGTRPHHPGRRIPPPDVPPDEPPPRPEPPPRREREHVVVMSPEEAAEAMDEETAARAARARVAEDALPLEAFASKPIDHAHGVGTLEEADAAAASRGDVRRRDVLRRLGGEGARTGRDLARAGMLWSEVLGPPRALSGPHASPPVRRARAVRASRPG
jgi:hypothetical protein